MKKAISVHVDDWAADLAIIGSNAQHDFPTTHAKEISQRSFENNEKSDVGPGKETEMTTIKGFRKRRKMAKKLDDDPAKENGHLTGVLFSVS